MTKDSITAVNRAIVMMLQGRIRFRMVSLLRSNCWWVYGWAPRRRLQLPLSEQTGSYAPPPKPEFSFRRPIIALPEFPFWVHDTIQYTSSCLRRVRFLHLFPSQRLGQTGKGRLWDTKPGIALFPGVFSDTSSSTPLLRPYWFRFDATRYYRNFHFAFPAANHYTPICIRWRSFSHSFQRQSPLPAPRVLCPGQKAVICPISKRFHRHLPRQLPSVVQIDFAWLPRQSARQRHSLPGSTAPFQKPLRILPRKRLIPKR